ncbi:MAG: carotenoid 1,2-hydratase [Chromatiales bacterium]|nr:carotenoid 1,2-hydratase [Chromatiales bacterium]
MRSLLLLAGIVALLVAVVLSWPGAAPPPERFTLAALMGETAETESFMRALGPARFEFPRDHGPHPGFRNEWWYFTGNLVDETGSEWGFQLTFFRFELSARPPERDSRWATNEVWMAHFAITDAGGRRHEARERFGRPAPGGAGASTLPFAVWLDNWSARSLGEEFFPLALEASDPASGMHLDLILEAGRPPLLHGEDGLSQKGPEPGNASYYYTLTRMPAAGSLSLGTRSARVSGLAWLDREWGTSALGEGTAGWDWFGLTLSDGSDLMLYGLRRSGGGWQDESAGTLRRPDGSLLRLSRDDFQLTPGRRWRSPASGVSWPVDWRLEVPVAGLVLDVLPLLDDQEQNLAVRYWEGAVRLLDADGVDAGRGYMELVGYGD